MAKFVLTEREKAIARDEDPDAIGIAPVEDEVQGQGSELTDTEGQNEPVEEAAASGQDDEQSSWINDDIRAAASTYGISEDDLKADFADQKEFDRFRKYQDKLTISRSAKPDTKPQDKPPVDEAKPEEKKPEEKAKDALEELILDLNEYPESEYEKPVHKVIKAVKSLQDEIKSLREKQAAVDEVRQHIEAQRQQEQQKNIAEFDGALSEYDAETFGDMSKGKVKPEQEANRQRVFESARLLYENRVAEAHRRGDPPPRLNLKELANHVASILFEKKDKGQMSESQRQAVREQSRRRRPVAKTSSSGSNKTPAEDTDAAIANNPKLTALWNRMQVDNGSV